MAFFSNPSDFCFAIKQIKSQARAAASAVIGFDRKGCYFNHIHTNQIHPG
jgi:hypothetical protein